MLACSAMVACTNDDVIENHENQVKDGEKAYVVVNINNAGGYGSRAADGGLAHGDEHEIKTVNFYFYSAEGTYITEGTVTNIDGTDVNETLPYVEFKTKTVVVLNDLAQKGTPKYVLAVLNQPTSNFDLTGKSISDVQEVIMGSLTEVDEYGYTMSTIDNKKYYIMSNSTYQSTTDVDQTGFFATTIDEEQFLEQPIMSEAELQKITPVEIYVERLAAKVQLSLGEDVNTEALSGVEGTFFKLNEINTVTSSDDDLAGSPKQYYAQIVGWNLNATNKQTNLVKSVDTSFANLEDETAYETSYKWNDPLQRRSYWGYSWNYNDAAQVYPDNFKAADDNGTNQGTDGKNGTTTASKYALDYVKWSELENEIDQVDYCAENTNTKTILEDQNFHAAATEILLAAKIVDEKGIPVELFRYDNVLYDKANYINRLFAKVNPQICYQTNTGTDDAPEYTYTYITANDVVPTIVNENDGKVSVSFALRATEDGVYTQQTWGSLSGETFTVDTDADATVTALNNAFKVLFDKERDADQTAYVLADHYNGGMMYYNIPIEHLRLGDGTPYTNGKINVAEAEYGVVRNHWYQVTVNKIENLGTAVHDAEEDIIPTKDENVRYYVAARINVLSWKVVRQGVDL